MDQSPARPAPEDVDEARRGGRRWCRALRPFDGLGVAPSMAGGDSPIGANNLFIAAHARSLGLTLVTNNSAESARVEGLRVENWTQPPRRVR